MRSLKQRGGNARTQPSEKSGAPRLEHAQSAAQLPPREPEGAGPLEGGAYRGGVQAGPEGAGACWPRLTQEAGATSQAGWSSGAWPQGKRWVRRRGQSRQPEETSSAGRF